MLKIEIASYPKSGNTWFRYLAKDFLVKMTGAPVELPPDIHARAEQVEGYKPVFIRELNDSIVIYKSHVFDNPKALPDKIIHIYRHPLDVFLSSRNYLHLQSGKMGEATLKKLFIGGLPKSVEMIVADGELGYYFDEFLAEAGANYWNAMLGKKSNYFEYVLDAVKGHGKAVSVRYEDMVVDAGGAANTAFRAIFGEIPYVEIDLAEVDNSTKFSKHSGFFWKSVPKNYERFLTPRQVEAFNGRYETELAVLGYI